MKTPPAKIGTHIDRLRKALGTASILVFDFETSDVRPRSAIIAGLGIYLPEAEQVFYINTGHQLADEKVPRVSEAQLADAIRVFFGEPNKHAIAHNATYDLRLLFKLGITVRCRISCSLIHTHRADENLRSFGREATFHYHLPQLTYGLKELTQVYFKVRPPTLHGTIGKKNTISAPPAAVGKYCIFDCINTWNLYERCQKIFQGDKRLGSLIGGIDDPNNVVLAKMMWEGISVDVEEAERQRAVYERSIQACREAIWKTLGIDWGLDTPAHVRRVLRHMDFQKELDYDPFWEPYQETVDKEHEPDGKASEPSIAREVLEDVFAECSSDKRRTVIALFLSMWQMKQRISSFLRPLPEKVQYTDGRLYPDRFSSTLATTRFSSSPNLQNLPGRADKVGGDDEWRGCLPAGCDEHFKTRDIFVAKPGYVFVSMDLSAAEPRYLSLLFQRALDHQDTWYRRERSHLQQLRRAKFPTLMEAMYKLQDEDYEFSPTEIEWPAYVEDPLWRVFAYGVPFDDPYNALLATIDEEGYQQAEQAGKETEWLADNRWRGKKAFLALAYGSGAETLAPQLNWTVERTREAIECLENEYATLNPLRELTLLEMIHLGEVRTLWDRPRRINGYYQLARPDPCTIQFYRMRPTFRRYVARIIPLGSTKQGVQAFIEECYVERDDGRRGEVVLAGNPDGTIKHIDKNDVFVRAEHFNRPPFRNVNFSQIDWIEDEHGLKRFLPRQARGRRQAFNARCQSTGADHLRWLMNRMDRVVCSLPAFSDCRLVLTVHDSLMYEVPQTRVDAFIKAARPVMHRRPDWSSIDMKVDVEIGPRCGQLQKVKLL